MSRQDAGRQEKTGRRPAATFGRRSLEATGLRPLCSLPDSSAARSSENLRPDPGAGTVRDANREGRSAPASGAERAPSKRSPPDVQGAGRTRAPQRATAPPMSQCASRAMRHSWRPCRADAHRVADREGPPATRSEAQRSEHGFGRVPARRAPRGGHARVGSAWVARRRAALASTGGCAPGPQVCEMLERAVERVGRAPKYTVTDQGPQFWGAYRGWCERHGVKPRYGAVGEHGSLAVIERFFLTLKSEAMWSSGCPTVWAMRAELLAFVRWHDAYRPHQSFGGRTPAEVYEGLERADQRARNGAAARPHFGQATCTESVVS
jgi:transposase InsO family protein